MRPWSRFWPQKAASLDVDKVIGSFEPVTSVVKAMGARESCALTQAETGYCYSWRRLSDFIVRVGAWLQGLGAGRGAQVAVASENLIEAISFSLAAMAAGSRLVLIDPLTIGEDLKFQLEGRSIVVVAGSRSFLSRSLNAILESTDASIVELAPGDSMFKVEGKRIYTLKDAASYTGSLDDPGLGPGDDAFSIYYAGIAGRTMQVIHSHGGLWTVSKVFSTVLGIDGGEGSLLATPFTHVLGFQASLIAPLLEGAPVYAMARWNPQIAASLVASGEVSYIAGVPLMFQQLLDAGRGIRLRHALSAGAPLSPELQLRFREHTGTPLLQGYGMSETMFLTLQTPALADVEGTIGVPLPGVDVKLIDPERGEDLPLGSTGELLVKAPWVMKGYEFPEENEKAFINGWLRTGDIIHVREDGVMFFRGIKKRIIKYKGYAVLLGDLEAVLKTHPDVVKVEVYGEPAGEVGQVPVARVWLREGSQTSSDELLSYVNSRVAFYKKLRRVEIAGYL